MTSKDLESANTLNEPTLVTPRKASGASVVDGALTARLPPYSYHMIRVRLS